MKIMEKKCMKNREWFCEGDVQGLKILGTCIKSDNYMIKNKIIIIMINK